MPDTALILVDLQNDVVYHRSTGIRELIAESNVIDHCGHAIDQARAQEIPIVFVTVRRRASGLDAVSNTTDRSTGQPEPLTCVAGTPGADLVGALKVRDDDLVVTKRRRSGFVGTELDWLLRRHGIRTVLLGGIATNWGVESTARSAYDLGYDVVVLADCCCGFTSEDHEWAMTRILPNMARVRTAEQAFAELAAGAYAPPSGPMSARGGDRDV